MYVVVFFVPSAALDPTGWERGVYLNTSHERFRHVLGKGEKNGTTKAFELAHFLNRPVKKADRPELGKQHVLFPS